MRKALAENDFYKKVYAQQLDSVDVDYRRFFRMVHLREDELSELRHLLAYRHLESVVSIDKDEAAKYKEVITIPASFPISLYKESDLLQLLGPPQYDVLTSFQLELPSRTFLNDFINSKDNPVDEPQSDFLVKALTSSRLAENLPPKSGPPSDVEAFYLSQTQLANAVAETCLGVLPDAQVALIQAYLQQKIASQRSAYEVYRLGR